MPVSAEYTAQVLTLRLVGEYSHDELRQCFREAFPAEDALTGGLLIDLTHSTSVVTRPTDEMNSMSEWWAKHGTRFHHRLALVACEGTVQFGLAWHGSPRSLSSGRASQFLCSALSSRRAPG